MKRILAAVVCLFAVQAVFSNRSFAQEDSPDVLVVGAGIAGLSAALEAARHGADVQVLDMWSVFGGHALVSGGGLLLVGTPNQQAMGIVDTPEIAKQDFFSWGNDPDPYWVDYYVEHNLKEIHDWLIGLGASFQDPPDNPVYLQGNSRKRFHIAYGGGYGLVRAIYLSVVEQPNITFQYNTRAMELLRADARVVGVLTENTRTGAREELLADAVIIATGGFQSDLERVREHWPEPVPEQILIGSGINSRGSGFELVSAVGGALHHLERMWNYASGFKDPRDPEGKRGIRFFNPKAMWVNVDGGRFVNELAGERATLQALTRQPGSTYWAIFDTASRDAFGFQAPGWQRSWVEERYRDDPDFINSADTLEELAEKIGVPAERFVASVRRYNELVDRGEDEDFGRFPIDFGGSSGGLWAPQKIEEAPFFALQGYPLSRKSMGGVLTDGHTRVVDSTGAAIQGLYAAGEVTGFGGVNGIAGLEGTFLGPSLLMGRVAGSKATEDARTGEDSLNTQPTLLPAPAGKVAEPEPHRFESTACLGCHMLDQQMRSHAAGFEHFRLVHTVVLEREFGCAQCHSEMSTDGQPPHRTDAALQVGRAGPATELAYRSGAMSTEDYRALFELPEELYFLSHSVGCLPANARKNLSETGLDPWATEGEAWTTWLGHVEGFSEAFGELLGCRPDNLCPQVNLSSALTKIIHSLPARAERTCLLLSEDDFPIPRVCAQAGGTLRLPDEVSAQRLRSRRTLRVGGRPGYRRAARLGHPRAVQQRLAFAGTGDRRALLRTGSLLRSRPGSVRRGHSDRPSEVGRGFRHRLVHQVVVRRAGGGLSLRQR